MKSVRTIGYCGHGLLLGACFILGSTLSMAQSTDSAEINSLLSQAKSHAVLAADDAAALESFTHSQLGWQAHASKLEAMKTHVNDLGQVSKKLRALKSDGSPWQQEAIDRIDPLLQSMGSNLTATINHLNDHKTQIQMQPYRDYTKANYELADESSKMISDLVEYGKAKTRAEALEQKLEMPAGQ
jgi:hypothetical protein